MQAQDGHAAIPAFGMNAASAVQPAAAAVAMLDVDALVLGYGTGAAFTPAVSGVSFTVRQGETAALLGPSGCGKSTILKAVAGFLRPAGGRVLVGGKPVNKPGPDRAVVFQEFDQLFPWRTRGLSPARHRAVPARRRRARPALARRHAPGARR